MIDLLIENCNWLFTWLFHTSCRASILIGLVLIVQKTFRRWLTPEWQYGLWFSVLFCMLIPTPFENRLSIFNLFERFDPLKESTISTTPWKAQYNGEVTIPAKLQNAPEALSAQTKSNMPTSVPIEKVESTNSPIPINLSSPLIQRWKDHLFGILWFTGSCIITLYYFFPTLLLSLRIRKLHPLTNSSLLELLEECKDAVGIKIPIWVVETSHVKSPVLMGLVRPKLLLPKGLQEKFSREEIRFIFLHELAHVKQKDIATNWLMTILQILHWFNPIVWIGFSQMRADREIACDHLALSTMDEKKNKNYGATILKLLENLTTTHNPLPILAGILETKHQLKRRFSMISCFKKTRTTWTAFPLFLILIATGLTAAQKERPVELKAETPALLSANIKNTDQRGPPPVVTIEVRFLSMPHELAEELISQGDGTQRAVEMNEKMLQRIRELEKQNLIKVVTVPKITVVSGDSAKMLASKEFVYPSAFDVDSNPINFTTREIGTVLDVRATVDADGKMVHMSLSPEIIELVDSLKYECRLSSGQLTTCEQPVFSKRTLSTNVSVANGSTILLGSMNPPESEAKSNKESAQTMLVFLTPSFKSDLKIPKSSDIRIRLVTIEANLISMSMETAKELLKQEIGSRVTMEINQDTLQQIHKLEKIGKIKLISSPKLTSFNGETARILSTKEIISPFDWEKTGKSAIPKFSTREVGTILDVKAEASPDQSEISIALALEIIGFTEPDKNGENKFALFELPKFSKRSLTSSIILKNGSTILLSGMESPDSMNDPSQLMFTLLTARTLGFPRKNGH